MPDHSISHPHPFVVGIRFPYRADSPSWTKQNKYLNKVYYYYSPVKVEIGERVLIQGVDDKDVRCEVGYLGLSSWLSKPITNTIKAYKIFSQWTLVNEPKPFFRVDETVELIEQAKRRQIYAKDRVRNLERQIEKWNAHIQDNLALVCMIEEGMSKPFSDLQQQVYMQMYMKAQRLPY
jgi:hypothetical protein